MGGGTSQARTPKVKRLRLTPEAELDLDDAHAWYHAQSPRLARAFLAAIAMAIGSIQFFEVGRTEIVVYGVFHGARDPQSWRRRRRDA